MITKAPTKAAAYYRMSTDKQEDSIADQRKAVIRYAADNGYEIVAEYIDSGISGDATEKRLEFQRMIADSGSGRFNAILVWDMDRLGRFDALEGGFWLKPLRDNGIVLDTVATGLVNWDDFGGRVIWAVQQEAKHAFLRDLSRNVVRGVLESAKSGRRVGGKPPFGYAIDPETRRLVPGDPREIEIVRKIFHRYVNGSSLRSVATELNKAGIPSASGRKWSVGAVRFVLTNRSYAGDYVWNRRTCAKYNRIQNGAITPTRNRRMLENAPEDVIVIEGAHEPIIDPATFHQARKLLTARRGRTTPSKEKVFALTGLLFCGHCGYRMMGKTTHHKGQRHRVYTCAGYHRYGRAVCQCNAIRQDALLECLLTKIRESVIQAEDLPKLEAEIRRQLAERDKPTDGKLIEKQIAQLDGKIAKAQRRILEVDSDMLPVVQDNLRELRREREDFAAHLAAQEGHQSDLEGRHEQIVAEAMQSLSRLPETLEDADMSQLADVLTEIIGGIDLYFSHKKVNKYTRHQFERGLVRLRLDSRIIKHVQHGSA